MKQYFTILFFTLFFVNIAFSQTKRQIIDSHTKEPIPFATIIPDNNFSFAVVSDIDGFFDIKIPQNTLSITIKHVSYKTKTINKHEFENSSAITLQASVFNIAEVSVKAKDNPAHRIIRKVAKNKQNNNPDKQNYICDIYQQTTAGFEIKEGVKIDTTNKSLKNFADSNYYFLMETMSTKYYKNNKGSKEIVKAVKVSGFKRPEFFIPNNNIQPFHFYDEYINLYGIMYLSPISKQAIGKYYYEIKDTLINKADTVFSIVFRPYKNKVFNGLQGQMRISTNGYAIKDIHTKPAGHHLTQISVNQQYELVDDKWFPIGINYDLHIKDPNVKDALIKMQGRSRMSNIIMDTVTKNVKINDIAFLFDTNAFDKDSNYWNKYRIKTLSFKEKNTYTLMDSVTKIFPIEKLTNWGFMFAETGKVPIKFISLDLQHLYNYNPYEGIQLGLGLYANDRLIKWLELGGYFRYGFKDKRLKYGGDITFTLNKTRKFKMGGGYKNDLQEPGFNNFSQQQVNLFSRRLVMTRADSVVEYFAFAQRQFGKWFFRLTASQKYITPLYNYTFGNSIKSFDNQECNISVQYAPNQKTNYLFGHIFSVTNSPIFKLKYTYGFFNKKYLENYHKVLFSAFYKFNITGLGESKTNLKIGYINKPVPLFALIEGEGSFNKQVPFVFNEYFQAMKPGEFFNNIYSAIFYSHNFGPFVKISEKIKPELIISQNLAWGKLHNPEFHTQTLLTDLHKGYFESGILINNILLTNIYNFAYIGLGVGAFYRYGKYQMNKQIDNFAFKLCVSAKY